MKIVSKIFVLIAAIALFSCEDSSSIGTSITQEEVEIIVDSSFTVNGSTIYSEKIQSRTLTQLLGKINAQGFGYLTSDVVTQFMPADKFDTTNINASNIDSIKLLLQIPNGGYIGDSIAPMGLKVYRLNKQLPSPIYSNFDPKGYYSELDLLGSTTYSANALAASDSLKKLPFRTITIDLPIDLGREFFNKYKEYGALLNDGTITAKQKIGVKDNKLAELGDASEFVELSIDTILKMSGYSNKIVSFKSGAQDSDFPRYFFVDELGDMYCLKFEHFKCSIEKIEEKIIFFVLHGNDYYALDENGQIWSNQAAFTSSDWILTTSITCDGEKIYSDVPPYIKEGRTLAPIRAILEALGMTVSWDSATQTATAVKGNLTITVSINSHVAYVNNEQKTLDVPAEITNGRTFVPVRFFAEALGMNVGWDEAMQRVILTSN